MPEEITESPKSMQEFYLGAYLMTLRDFLYNPEAYDNIIPNDVMSEINQALDMWWDKYYEDLEATIT
jgi:hypothetical protein